MIRLIKYCTAVCLIALSACSSGGDETVSPTPENSEAPQTSTQDSREPTAESTEPPTTLPTETTAAGPVGDLTVNVVELFAVTHPEGRGRIVSGNVQIEALSGVEGDVSLTAYCDGAQETLSTGYPDRAVLESVDISEGDSIFIEAGQTDLVRPRPVTYANDWSCPAGEPIMLLELPDWWATDHVVVSESQQITLGDKTYLVLALPIEDR